MSMLWRKEVVFRIRSKEDPLEKAQAIEVTIPVKKFRKHGPSSVLFRKPFLGQTTGWDRNQ